MRLLLYNIAYGTGAPRHFGHSMVTMHRYIRPGAHHQRKLREFITSAQPDIVGLLEVDRGSMRTRQHDQVAEIAHALVHKEHYGNKYGLRSLLRRLPIVRHQGNAILTRYEGACVRHYFNSGIKRLVIEIQIGRLRFLLVHLAVSYRVRVRQYRLLGNLIGRATDPVVVGGDFNSFRGAHELEWLRENTGLYSANMECRPTFPSWRPRHEVDFVFCSPAIRVNDFQVMDHVRFSDHLPLYLDFDVA